MQILPVQPVQPIPPMDPYPSPRQPPFPPDQDQPPPRRSHNIPTTKMDHPLISRKDIIEDTTWERIPIRVEKYPEAGETEQDAHLGHHIQRTNLIGPLIPSPVYSTKSISHHQPLRMEDIGEELF
ncbi:hypothetical protein PIB30_112063 [Stylosanthes scabra]|uniref:Uncharacterized protein n=1 Tax=Stylosanthes scabra TaxID=79078 RepID=A0ABU6T1Y5_9FABA|nr:hypothetical protein [Stylosanthes scabra]